MQIKTTNRGFTRIEFTDILGQTCSLQESSSIEPRIWLGADDSRMELTAEQVAVLIPHLQKFVETGNL